MKSSSRRLHHLSLLAGLLLTALTLWPCQPVWAAEPTASLSARLVPEHLGAGTTIEFGLTINPPPGEFPPALREIDLRYPANLGIETSGLGTATCRAATLETDGPPGCPRNSIVGYGSATVEVPFGTETLYETARAALFMAPLQHEDIGLLFYVDGESPVSAQLVFPGIVLPAPAPFGGDLATTVPLIASVPEAPDAAILALSMTLGPSGITYYEYAKHRKIAYHPRGILLPQQCPPGGFAFAADLDFNSGSQTSAEEHIPCPRTARRHSPRRSDQQPRHSRQLSQNSPSTSVFREHLRASDTHENRLERLTE